MQRPTYDYNDAVFQKKRHWFLYAKEHVDLYELHEQSDLIDIAVESTVGPLAIPTVYHVTYRLRSITGVDEEAQPIYGDEHVMELTVPTRYPLEPAAIYMRTEVWHPNIQSGGRFKGKICGNVSDFGVDYSLRQLVLRVGEILQYKNYLADFVPPYPEDPKVAEWVKAYGEPRGIVDIKAGIYTDDRPLVRAPERPMSDEPTSDEPAAAGAPAEKKSIRIGPREVSAPPPRRRIRLGGPRPPAADASGGDDRGGDATGANPPEGDQS